MGFMAGFGSAFAQSFNQENQAIQQHQDDIFKMRYTDYITQRDKREAEDKQNAKNMKAAAALAQTYSQPDEAKWAIYDMLNSGVDQSIIAKQLLDNQAVVSQSSTTKPGEAATPADPRDNLTDAAQSSVDGQMEASGMKAPKGGGIFAGSTAATNVSSPSTGTGGANRPASSLSGTFHDIFSSQGKTSRATDRANADISAVTGKSVDEINRTIAGEQKVETDPIPGRPDVQIKWQPKAGVGWFDDMAKKVNTVADAQVLYNLAQEKGTPSQQAWALKTLNDLKKNSAEQAHLAAQENGTGFTYSRGFVKDANGVASDHQVRFVPGNNVDIPDHFVDEGTGEQFSVDQVIPVNKDQEAALVDVAKEAQKPYEEYNQSKLQYKQAVRIASTASKLAKENPGAIGIPGNIAQGIDMLRRAGLETVNLVRGPRGFEPPTDQSGNVVITDAAQKDLDKAEDFIQKQLQGEKGGLIDRASKTALQATLLDIQTTKLAYMMAAQQGQAGHAISNKDFQAFKNSASGGGNPEALRQAAAQMIQEQHQKLIDMEKQLTAGGPATAAYKNRYGKNAKTGFEIPSTIDTEIAEDPDLKAAIDSVNAAIPDTTGQQVDTKIEAPEWLSKAVDSEGNPITPEVYQELPQKSKDILKKKYGTGG
jgi:hypothetical protein